MKMEIGQNRFIRRILGIATGGAATIAASSAITSLLRIISSVTLTRLLDPHAYGVVAVVTSIAFMVNMLTEVGLYAFIVRHREGSEDKFLDEVWTIRLLRGFGLTAAMIALAWPATHLLGKPEIALVVAVWSVSFALDGLASLSFATAVRAQKLWRMVLLDVIPGIATFVLSIGTALVWQSYWAMIIGMVGGSVVKCYISYSLFPGSQRKFRLNFARSRELWSFSRYVAASSALSLVLNQADKLILAKMMPLPIFGLYSTAVTLNLAPSQIASRYTTRVLFAKYSRAARVNRGGLMKQFYAARRKVALLYMFAASSMITAAPLVIELLYDPRYRGVVPFMQLLAIATALRMPSYAANQVLIADGRTKSTLYANIFRIVWLAAGIGVMLKTGHIMLLVGAVGTMEIPALICFWIALERAKLLNLLEESYGLIAGAAGLVVGLAVNDLLLPFVR